MNTETKEILDILINAPHIFGHYLGYTKLLPIHTKAIKYIWDTKESRTLQAHRGWYKTTAVIELGSIRNLILCPDERVMILRKEFDKNIKPLLRSIGGQLKKPIINNIVQLIYGKDLELIKCTDSEIETNLKTTATREPNILGMAIGQSMTGLHVDRALTDDIVTTKDRTSRAERENVKLIYQELNNIVDPGCPISNTGTPWHKEDAFKLMPEPLKFPIETTEIPAFTKEHLFNVKSRMAASLYAANYSLKHIAAEDALFPDIKYFNGEIEGNVFAQLDARYSGKDITALTIGSQIGTKIQLYGIAWDKHVDDCLSDIISLLNRFNVRKIYLEDNADKGYLAKDIRKLFPSVKRYHESMNKHIKIITFLKKRWPDVSFHHESNDLYIELINDYNEQSDHDDAPDSAASLIRECFTKDMTVSYHTS